MAFLSENAVLEFYDLTLENGGRNTRLVLRQGTASFHVNPGNEDYFSVTGGDFTVAAGPRSTFRMDNSDGGSTVDITKGRINVIHGKITTPLVKGQSLSMQAGNDAIDVGRLPNDDDFDRWVSGRVDSVVTATNAALQYANSPYYTSGFGDLYTYGSWYPISGYGNCWRPYGAGFGWSPFDSGGWFSDPFYGTGFIGNQPWGWLPYHFGGWIFDPLFGWLWAPGGFGYGGFVNWSPATARFVRSKTGLLGVVPVHPLDAKNNAPINLAQGVMPLKGGVTSARVPVQSVDGWKVVKNPPREAFGSDPARVGAPPLRSARTIIASNTNERVGAVSTGSGSTISYDPREHRFVNSNPTPAELSKESEARNENAQPGKDIAKEQRATPVLKGTAAAAASTTARASIPPARVITPPPAPRTSSSGNSRGESSGEGSSRGASPSHASSAAGSHPSSGGGRPH